MLPGVVSVSLPERGQSKGSPPRVAVLVSGNPSAVAIGSWIATGSPGSPGVAAQLVHVYGDELWKLTARSPEGFSKTDVRPIASATETVRLEIGFLHPFSACDISFSRQNWMKFASVFCDRIHHG